MGIYTVIEFFQKGGLFTTTGQIVDSLEMASVKALNCISDFRKKPEAQPRTTAA